MNNTKIEIVLQLNKRIKEEKSFPNMTKGDRV
jgi:hypothetical protein